MGSKPIDIKVPTAKVNISPLGFFRYGSDFFVAAVTFEKPRKGFSPVPYYLYSKSIELLFKAFLLANGFPKKDLGNRKILRHDLIKAMEQAKTLKIGEVVLITPEEEKEVEKANKYYDSKGFEYFDIMKAILGYPDLPDLKILKGLASKLVENLENICLRA